MKFLPAYIFLLILYIFKNSGIEKQMKKIQLVATLFTAALCMVFATHRNAYGKAPDTLHIPPTAFRIAGFDTLNDDVCASIKRTVDRVARLNREYEDMIKLLNDPLAVDPEASRLRLELSVRDYGGYPKNWTETKLITLHDNGHSDAHEGLTNIASLALDSQDPTLKQCALAGLEKIKPNTCKDAQEFAQMLSASELDIRIKEKNAEVSKLLERAVKRNDITPDQLAESQRLHKIADGFSLGDEGRKDAVLAAAKYDYRSIKGAKEKATGAAATDYANGILALQHVALDITDCAKLKVVVN
jgi:hypothetical protein